MPGGKIYIEMNTEYEIDFNKTTKCNFFRMPGEQIYIETNTEYAIDFNYNVTVTVI